MSNEAKPLTVLAGIRILSFTQFLLGPAGVQYLADLGADVIQIEPPGGKLFERNWSGCDLFLNGVSALYLCAHRNQRSLTLNLKHPEGLAVAKRLMAGRVRLLRSPLVFSSGQAAFRRPAPMPGEHTGEILKESGYTEGGVHRLRERGVV
jgi:crotonobetainyl-CoA:carnitine CoA-transferase CaiB-like acyl-CoA transferase